MSSSANDPTRLHPSNEDDVNMRKIIIVGAVSLAIFALSTVIAYAILRVDTGRLEAQGRPPVPAAIGRDEIGIVDQPVFEHDRRLDQWKAAKKKRLSSYGWVDKKKGLIHIPIDQAIDEVISQGRGGAR